MIVSDSFFKSIYNTMHQHEKYHTIQHSKNVTDFALSFCKENTELEHKIKLACALHDISVIIPKDRWLDECRTRNIKVCEEEIEVTLLLHQKLSEHMAMTQFDIYDEDILSAIGCHTTLKKNASTLDLIVFIADKMAWDGEGIPPWHDVVSKGLEVSLYKGAYEYINYLINSNGILVVHPMLRDAYGWLKEIL